jgi:hypothetical protein
VDGELGGVDRKSYTGTDAPPTAKQNGSLNSTRSLKLKQRPTQKKFGLRSRCDGSPVGAASFVRDLALGPVMIVGWSFGGAI